MKITRERFTTEDGDTLAILVDGETVALIDLERGASLEARVTLARLGLNLDAVLAAAWADDS